MEPHEFLVSLLEGSSPTGRLLVVLGFIAAYISVLALVIKVVQRLTKR